MRFKRAIHFSLSVFIRITYVTARRPFRSEIEEENVDSFSAADECLLFNCFSATVSQTSTECRALDSAFRLLCDHKWYFLTWPFHVSPRCCSEGIVFDRIMITFAAAGIFHIEIFLLRGSTEILSISFTFSTVFFLSLSIFSAGKPKEE